MDTDKQKVNSVQNSVRPQTRHLKPFQKGHKKVGGVKKGWVSIRVEIRKLLQEMTNSKDGQKITYKMALLNKLLHKAIIQGDVKSIQMILEYADGKPTTPIDITSGGVPLPLLDINAIRKNNSGNKDNVPNKKN